MTELLLLLGGAGAGLFGLVITLGSMLSMGDGSGLVAHLFLTAAFGIAPMVLGALMMNKGRKGLGRRKREAHERRTLDLARRRGGVLTVAELARSTAMTLAEAQELLTELHISGHCTATIDDQGVMSYSFGELGDASSVGNVPSRVPTPVDVTRGPAVIGENWADAERSAPEVTRETE